MNPATANTLGGIYIFIVIFLVILAILWFMPSLCHIWNEGQTGQSYC